MRTSERVMAPDSSPLTWKTPWTEKPGGLQSMGLLRVGNDWATSFSLFTFLHWRSKWQHTPVHLSGESQGWRSVVGCRLWGRIESDTTEVMQQQQQQQWEPAVQRWELCSLLCADLNGQEIWKRGDMRVCTTNSFWCMAETNTVL